MLKVLAIKLCVVIAVTGAQASEWKKVANSTPTTVDEWLGARGGDFRQVLALSASNALVAVGARGAVSRSSDGGTSWSDSPSGTAAWLSAVTELSDRQTLVAVGAEGDMLRSADGGKTWGAPIRLSNKQLYGIAAVPNTKLVVAVGQEGTTLVGATSGDQVRWDAPSSQGDQSLYGITGVPGTNAVIAVGLNGTVLQGTVSGDHVRWDAPTHHGDEDLFAVTAVPNTNLVIAVGDRGTVLRGIVVRDQVRWDAPMRQGDKSLNNIAAVANANLVIAVGEGGTVLRGVTNGDQVLWSAPTQQGDKDLSAVAAVPNTATVVAVGSSGTVLRGTISGDQLEWETPTGKVDDSLYRLAPVPDTNLVIAVGPNGTVLRGTTIGDQVRWDTPTRQGDQFLSDVVVVPKTNLVIAVGYNGAVLRGTVAGNQVQWDAPTRQVGESLHRIKAVPNTNIVIAVGANGTVLRGTVSGDQVRWDAATREGDQFLYGLAIVPNTNLVIAVGTNGTVLRGTVTGDRVQWDAPTHQGNAFFYDVAAVPNTNFVIAVGSYGTVLRGTVTGNQVQWDAPTYQSVNHLLAIAAVPNTNAMVAVGNDGTFIQSKDGGVTWIQQIVHVGDLSTVAPLNSHLAVGTSLIDTIGKPLPIAAASEYRFGAAGDTLSLAWRYPRGARVECSYVFYDILGTHESARPINTASLETLPSSEEESGYTIAWSPADRGIGSGAKLRYSVECRDLVLGVSWRQVFPEIQLYNGPKSVFEPIIGWINSRPTWLQLLLAVASLVMFWCCVLVVLWRVAPEKLVALHERLPDPKTLDEAAEAADKPTAGLAKVLHLLGLAALLRFGTSRRALDAWVSARVPEMRRRFALLNVVRDRRISVELPVALNGTRLDQPWTGLDSLFRKPSISLLIAGPGGGGKTTLACRIGRRLLAEDGAPLGGIVCLPLLIDRDLEESDTGDGLLPFLAGALRAMLGVPRISSKLAEALVRSGSVLVIVDGLSERNEATRRAFDPARPNFPIMRLVVTSRDSDRRTMDAVMETLAISSDGLYSFIERYIDEAIAIKIAPLLASDGQRPSEAEIYDACAQLKRLLRDKPTTPLLAAMWAEEVAHSGRRSAERIRSVAELIDSYIERLLNPAAGGNAVRLDSLRLDLVAIASRELGATLTPRWLTRTNVINALRERNADDPDKRIDILLESHLLELDARNPELVRITLDPIAEHLVARSRVEEMAGDVGKWRTFSRLLKRCGSPAGFVEAISACADARGYGYEAKRESDADLRGLLDTMGIDPATNTKRQQLECARPATMTAASEAR
jgi:photosystem II stability/assembly factor-like uncharacterized protein